MTARRPRIAIDFSTYDILHMGYGLYRYPVELVLGLTALRPDADFVLIGSRSQVVPELSDALRVGLAWDYVQFVRRRGQGGNFLDQLPYSLLLRRLRVDLVHSLDFFFPWLLPIPVVLTVYDLMFELFSPPKSKQSSYIRCVRRLIRHRVRRVIAISETTARDVRTRWRVPPSRITTVSLGVALRSIRDLSPPEHPILLARYSLNPHKNLECLLRAVALVRHKFPQVKLVLFGRADVATENEGQFNTLLDALGLTAVVERTGFIPDDLLDGLYYRSAVFVLPSLYEGFGLPLVEAMSRGVCVVAHYQGATAEVVGNAGRLVDARTPIGLADGILDVLTNPDRRDQWVRAGIARASTFSRERMAVETFRVYKECLGQATSPPKPS